jgi:hypothetical protein
MLYAIHLVRLPPPRAARFGEPAGAFGGGGKADPT